MFDSDMHAQMQLTIYTYVWCCSFIKRELALMNIILHEIRRKKIFEISIYIYSSLKKIVNEYNRKSRLEKPNFGHLRLFFSIDIWTYVINSSESDYSSDEEDNV